MIFQFLQGIGHVLPKGLMAAGIVMHPVDRADGDRLTGIKKSRAARFGQILIELGQGQGFASSAKEFAGQHARLLDRGRTDQQDAKARVFGLNVRGKGDIEQRGNCLLYTSPSPRDQRGSRMPSSA